MQVGWPFSPDTQLGEQQSRVSNPALLDPRLTLVGTPAVYMTPGTHSPQWQFWEGAPGAVFRLGLAQGFRSPAWSLRFRVPAQQSGLLRGCAGCCSQEGVRWAWTPGPAGHPGRSLLQVRSMT